MKCTLCEKFEAIVRNMILKGAIPVKGGSLTTREKLIEEQKTLQGYPWFKELDFSRAPYWFDPDEYDCDNNDFEPYFDEIEVYEQFSLDFPLCATCHK